MLDPPVAFAALLESCLPLGLFLMFLVNSAGFRRALGRLLQGALPGLPRPGRRADPLDRPISAGCNGFSTAGFHALFRFIIKPLLWTGSVVAVSRFR